MSEIMSGFNPITKEVVDLDGNPSKILGWTFHVKKFREMVATADVKNAMNTAGLDESQVYDVVKENAMRKTVGDLKRKGIIKEVKNKVVTEIKDESKKTMVFQLDEKVLDSMSTELQLKFKKVGSLVLDLSSGIIQSSDPDVTEAANARLDIRQKAYDRQQFMNFLKRVIETNTGRIIVRIADGHYFFNVTSHDLLKKIVHMIKLVDPAAVILTVPYMKVEDNQTVVVQSTEESYIEATQALFKRYEHHKIENDGSVGKLFMSNLTRDMLDLQKEAEAVLIGLNAKTDLVLSSMRKIKKQIEEQTPREYSKEEKGYLDLAVHGSKNGLDREQLKKFLANYKLTIEDYDVYTSKK